jgi:glucose 1-dehydrogenase
VLDVNLTGAFLAARAAVREFLRRGLVPELSAATGKIAFTSSVHEAIPWAIRTPINSASWATEEAREELLRLIPYGRVDDPVDVACVIAWLVSDAADYSTGASLRIDGGMALYPAFRGQG